MMKKIKFSMLILIGLLSVSSCQKENLELSQMDNTQVKSKVEKESVSEFLNKSSVKKMNDVFFENKNLLDDYYMKDNARSLNPNKVPYSRCTAKDLKPLTEKFYGVGLEFLKAFPFTKDQLIRMTGKDDLRKLSKDEIAVYSLLAFVVIKGYEQQQNSMYGFRSNSSTYLTKLKNCFEEVVGIAASGIATSSMAAGGPVALTEMVAGAISLAGGAAVGTAALGAFAAGIAWCMW